MIPISQIHGNLSPYKENKVLLFGANEQGEQLLSLFQKHGIQVTWVCDPNTQLWNTDFCGYSVCDPEIISGLLHEHPALVVQLATTCTSKDLFEQIVHLIPFDEAWAILNFYDTLSQDSQNNHSLLQAEKIQTVNILQETIKLSKFSSENLDKPLLILCMPPKTGDHSLIQTFQRENIPHHFVFHMPEAIELYSLSQDHPEIKIITAVRDPIAENISLLYQNIGEIHRSLTARFLISGHFNRDFFEFGGNTQDLFELFIHSLHNPALCGAHPIQRFIPIFQKHISQTLQQDFDQKLGYGIARQGNVQIFTFQLEQLNQLLPQLSQFIGTKLSSLSNGNLTSNKWVASAYKQAQKDLTFSEDYFEECYSSDWVRHCYSQKSISTFQDKWKKNLK